MNTSRSIGIDFEWSPDFAKIVRRRFFSRGILRSFLVYLPIGIIGLLGVMLHVQKGESGGGYWFLICLSITPLVLWGVHHWATSYMRCNGAVPHISVRIEPESITIKSEKSDSTVKWSAFKTMWKFPDVILLFWGKKPSLEHSFAIPAGAIDADSVRFIENKIRENGGRVI